jgi:hypothetical protein
MTDSPLQAFLDLGMTPAAAQTLTYWTIAAGIVLLTIVMTWLVRNILLKAIVHSSSCPVWTWYGSATGLKCLPTGPTAMCTINQYMIKCIIHITTTGRGRSRA